MDYTIIGNEMSGCCHHYFTAEVACSYGCLAMDRELD